MVDCGKPEPERQSTPGRLQRWANSLKRDALILWLAARDPFVPLFAKIVAGLTAAYAFSPIDLIPDFIPVLGLVDDVLIVPAGLWLALKMVPKAVVARLRMEAAGLSERPVSRAGLAMVLIVWALAAVTAWRWLSPS
ncbi:MAG: DUF1232 domain-containing protein [Sphingomonas sp.]|nr:DUF1232 domain-containing protein [Sphingomonas sp.]RZV52242.1 MAG: DUF1232 domain-containing protein [Sphingomonadaceae bacterium]